MLPGWNQVRTGSLISRYWKQVSGPSLADRSPSVLKLRRSNPFMVMHQIQCSATGSLVKGAAVLKAPPQECAKKYILRSDPTPVAWIKSMYQQRPLDGACGWSKPDRRTSAFQWRRS